MGTKNPIASTPPQPGKKSKEIPVESAPRPLFAVLKDELVSELRDLTKDRTGKIVAASSAAAIVAFVVAIGVGVTITSGSKPKEEAAVRKKSQKTEPAETPAQPEAKQKAPKPAAAEEAAEPIESTQKPSPKVEEKPPVQEPKSAQPDTSTNQNRPAVDPKLLAEKRRELLTTGQGTVSNPADVQALIEAISEMNGRSGYRPQKKSTQ